MKHSTCYIITFRMIHILFLIFHVQLAVTCNVPLAIFIYHYMCLQDPDMFWDFITLRPETTHQVSFLFSDRGIPDGYRHMNGYGSHTFKLVNKAGDAVYCKFHYKVRILVVTPVTVQMQWFN